MHPVIPYTIASLLFGLGLYGVLVRRNAVLVLAAVELMLNAVNDVLDTADATVRADPDLPHAGSVFALFVIVLAAAEIGIGLAIVLHLFRLRGSIVVDAVGLGERVAHDESGRETGDPMDADADLTDAAGAVGGVGGADRWAPPR
jgi:NADH-quinone oxidoreductase subunit K